MDNWILSDYETRRDEMLLEASRNRAARLIARGRPNSLRGRIADGALAISELLAAFAQNVRQQS